jgi:hypothetical protein
VVAQDEMEDQEHEGDSDTQPGFGEDDHSSKYASGHDTELDETVD